MYYLFRHKRMRPMEYFNMGPGERRILHAFAIQESEDIQKSIEGKK